MQFHFEIEYKKGRENKAADSLSRVQLGEVTAMVVIPGMTEMFDRIKSSWAEDPTIKELLIRVQSQEEGVKEFTFVNQQLRRKGKLVVGANPVLREEILKIWHEKPIGGHSGIENTYKRVSSLFYWPRLKEDVTKMVKSCATCQRSKYDSAAYPGLLQPLKIPVSTWASVSIGFHRWVA